MRPSFDLVEHPDQFLASDFSGVTPPFEEIAATGTLDHVKMDFSLAVGLDFHDFTACGIQELYG